MGKWLGNIFDQIEQDIDRPQYGIFAEWSAHQFVYPAAQPFDLYVEKNHQQPYGERQRKCRVHVGGRDAAPIVQTQQFVDPAMISIGKRSIAFIIRTHTNTVSAAGATNA